MINLNPLTVTRRWAGRRVFPNGENESYFYIKEKLLHDGARAALSEIHRRLGDPFSSEDPGLSPIKEKLTKLPFLLKL